MKGGPKSSLRPFLHRVLQLLSHFAPESGLAIINTPIALWKIRVILNCNYKILLCRTMDTDILVFT